MLPRVPVAVIGAGPAGLAAATASAARGVPAIVLEQGPELADREFDDATDIVSGTGGAGLFSDGKFSFYPSASAVWNIKPREYLEEAYNWLVAVTRSVGMESPPLPSAERAAAVADSSEGFKRYPSLYMSLQDRGNLINQLARNAQLRNRAKVHHISPTSGGFIVQINGQGRPEVIWATALVYAGGRFGPLYLTDILPSLELIFRRLEVGVRIEQHAEHFFLRDDQQVDSKLIIRTDEGLECRTFCCCRNGRMVKTLYDGLTAVSGHSDGPATGRSNVGFNIRLADPRAATDLWSQLLPRLRDDRLPVSEPIERFLDPSGRMFRATELRRTFGDTLSLQLAQGLRQLMRHFPRGALDGATLVGPTVEGVGMYPKIQADLRARVPGLWVPGDAGGGFRGLTAAMISGYSAGLAAAAHVVTTGQSRWRNEE